MQLNVYNIEASKIKTIDVPESIYNVEMNEAILHSVIKAYQANRRQGTHATKTKAFVSGGGKKPFKQKGTGGARQGSLRNPHMPGGGEAHGPQPRDYRQYTTKKARRLALKVALSEKVRHGKLIVVNDFLIEKYSTKQVKKILSNFGAQKTLLADERKDDMLFKSARNLYGTKVLPPAEINAESVLKYEHIIISETALTSLAQRFQETKE